MDLVRESLRNRVVWIVDKADADAVVLRNVEGLDAVALSKATDTPLLDARILQVL